ncbi:WD40-repeat-containing domain protein, partial [Mycena rosella]
IAKCLIRIIFDGHQQEINSLEFSFDNRLIISGSGDRTVRIWYTLRVLSITPDPEPLSAPSNPPINADAGVTSVAISPDGAVTAGCIEAVVRIWSVAMGALGELLHGHPDSVYSVVLTRDGYGIVSGSFDNTLKHWDLRGGTACKEGGKASVCTTNLLRYEVRIRRATNLEFI